MNLFLAQEDSLALLRHARRTDRLVLAPVNQLEDLSTDTVIRPGALCVARPAEIGEVTVDRPIRLRFPDDARRCQSKFVLASPTLSSLGEHSYLEVLLASGAPFAAEADGGVRLFVEAPALALVSAERSACKSISAGRISRNAALARLIELAMELTGSYARDPTHPLGGEIFYGCDPLTSVAEMSEHLRSLGGRHGAKLARRALAYANDGSGSPMETLWYLLFCLPPSLGGLHLERPLQNVALEIPESLRSVACHQQLRPDFFWPGYRRVGEYDSALHMAENAFYEDRRRAKDYGLLGLAYFPITDRDTASATAVKAFLVQFAKSVEPIEGPAFTRRIRRILSNPEVDAAREVLRAALMPPPARWRDE